MPLLTENCCVLKTSLITKQFAARGKNARKNNDGFQLGRKCSLKHIQGGGLWGGRLQTLKEPGNILTRKRKEHKSQS